MGPSTRPRRPRNSQTSQAMARATVAAVITSEGWCAPSRMRETAIAEAMTMASTPNSGDAKRKTPAKPKAVAV